MARRSPGTRADEDAQSMAAIMSAIGLGGAPKPAAKSMTELISGRAGEVAGRPGRPPKRPANTPDAPLLPGL